MFPHPPFRPDQFAMCDRAYTAALLDSQNQPDAIGRSAPTDSTCVMVALRIIEASANGVRDLPGLKQRALVDLIVQH